MKKVFIIAEAGVNHNGVPDQAHKLVDVAKDAGADAVKFQTFKAEKVISEFAEKAEYQKKTTPENESQLDMVKKLELTPDDHKKLMRHCLQKEILFLSNQIELQPHLHRHRNEND